MIHFDPKNPRSAAANSELTARLSEPPEGVHIVIGGDGFMLHTVAAQAAQGVFLGLNAGHVGFLLNDIDDWGAVVDRLAARAWTTHAFPLIEARITTRDGEKLVEHAMNDVYLERSTGQTARIALRIDGHEVVENLVADGIILCTALGSTAYSFSAGGAPCHPEIPILGVTPICPHLPKLSPFVLPSTSTAHLDVLHPEHRPVRLVADGRDIEDVASVDVRISDRKVQLAYFEGRDLTATMVGKIVRRA